LFLLDTAYSKGPSQRPFVISVVVRCSRRSFANLANNLESPADRGSFRQSSSRLPLPSGALHVSPPLGRCCDMTLTPDVSSFPPLRNAFIAFFFLDRHHTFEPSWNCSSCLSRLLQRRAPLSETLFTRVPSSGRHVQTCNPRLRTAHPTAF